MRGDDAMDSRDMRTHQRNLVQTEIDVNDGKPYRGGLLHDLSVGGAAVTYPPEASPTGEPLEVGQTLVLSFAGKTGMPTRIVRIFDGGFAGKFDFTLDESDDKRSGG